MKRISKKKAARDAECREFRQQHLADIGRCDLCDPAKRRNSRLELHEIARGPLRAAAQDKAYAILCLCQEHHETVDGWPHARQLAVLKTMRPRHYNLAAFNAIVGYSPTRITEEDVEKWI